MRLYNDSTSGEMQPFPVKKIVSAALIAPIAYVKVFVVKSIPAMVVLGGSYLIFLVSMALFASKEIGLLLHLTIISLFIIGVIFSHTILAETILRILLLGPESIPGWGFHSWKLRDTRFLGWSIALGLIITISWLLLFWLLSSVLYWGGGEFMTEADHDAMELRKLFIVIPASIFIAYVEGRFAFVLAATAIERKPNLRWSANFTQAYQWSTFLIIGITPEILGIIMSYLGDFLPGIMGIIISTFFFVYLSIFTLSLLSYSYLFLVDAQPDKLPPGITDDEKIE